MWIETRGERLGSEDNGGAYRSTSTTSGRMPAALSVMEVIPFRATSGGEALGAVTDESEGMFVKGRWRSKRSSLTELLCRCERGGGATNALGV